MRTKWHKKEIHCLLTCLKFPFSNHPRVGTRLTHLASIGEIGSVYPASDYHGDRPSEPNAKTEVGEGLVLSDVY